MRARSEELAGINKGLEILTSDESRALFSKAIKPGEAELERNPRARSSVLRHATRTATPAREAA